MLRRIAWFVGAMLLSGCLTRQGFENRPADVLDLDEPDDDASEEDDTDDEPVVRTLTLTGAATPTVGECATYTATLLDGATPSGVTTPIHGHFARHRESALGHA